LGLKKVLDTEKIDIILHTSGNSIGAHRAFKPEGTYMDKWRSRKLPFLLENETHRTKRSRPNASANSQPVNPLLNKDVMRYGSVNVGSGLLPREVCVRGKATTKEFPQ
jgi:hypothetical protein